MVSRSWPKLPIMCGIATLTTVASMTDRKVPIITEAATSHLPADVGSLSAEGPRDSTRAIGFATPIPF